MAKFINTKKAVAEIEDLIKDATEKLILISPYLKLSKDFKDLLTFRNSQDKITTIIFGKQELNPDELKFLQGLRFVILKYKEDLHAKCYSNDDKMIITSLNFYEYSMTNNKEMGVLIYKNDPIDTQLFDDAMKEVEDINRTSQRFEVGNAKQTTSFKQPEVKSSNWNNGKASNTGFCIRTRVQIPFNLDKPLSQEAFRTWSQFGDENYPEKYCHFSGEASNGETCVYRPIMKKNWQKAREVHGF